jgi:hypothetical protein
MLTLVEAKPLGPTPATTTVPRTEGEEEEEEEGPPPPPPPLPPPPLSALTKSMEVGASCHSFSFCRHITTESRGSNDGDVEEDDDCDACDA